MFNPQLYAIWRRHLEQHLPDQRATRVTNLLLMVVGMFQAQSVQLSKIARKLPVKAHRLSLTRRLRRFLDNEAVDASAWYHPWAVHLITSASSGGELRLIIDSTKVTAQHRMISIAVAYRRRALPLMWEWVPYPVGHSGARQQLAMLKRLRRLIPTQVQVSVVGDSEFSSGPVIACLREWQWDYALRLKGRISVRQDGVSYWRRLDELADGPGTIRWLPDVALTQEHGCPTHVLIYWRRGEEAPMFVATNQQGFTATWRLYKRRMWIEEMFGDMKGHGFDLEISRLQTPERLSRLTLVVSLLYLWLVAQGEQLILWQKTHLVDRRDRQDLSIFRLGWEWIEHCVRCREPISEHLFPNVLLVSGS